MYSGHKRLWLCCEFHVCYMITVSRQSEEDFEGSPGSGESDVEDNNLCSALVLCGPHGVGKTSMVYAVAKELGFKVSQCPFVNCDQFLPIRC